MPVQPYQTSFNQMVRDISRDRLDPRAGHLYNIVDCIPNEIGAPAAKRGGWAYASPALTAGHADADRVQQVCFGNFVNATGQLVAITRDDGGSTSRLQTIASSASATDQGATRNPYENPTIYRGLLIITDRSGSTAAQTWDGSAINSLAGSAPTAVVSCAYKDHVVLGKDNTNPQRVWFSSAGDSGTWNTTTGYIDTTGHVTALYPLRNQILVFHPGSIERIIGSIPPPGTDMSLQPVWDLGTDQVLSLAGSDSRVVFANTTGLYMTDGSEPVDLTKLGGMKSYWRSLFTSTRVVSGGYAWGYYFCTISDSGPLGAFVDAFMVDLATQRWIRVSNLTANCFFRRTADSEELYVGDFGEARVNTLGSFFNPSASVKNDGDGTAVTPVIEGPFGIPSVGLQTIRNLFVRYDIRDAATDNPTLALSYVTDPSSTSYTAVSGNDGNAYPLAETTAATRVKRVINKSGLGVGWKLAQSNASATTKLFEVDYDGTLRDPARV